MKEANSDLDDDELDALLAGEDEAEERGEEENSEAEGDDEEAEGDAPAAAVGKALALVKQVLCIFTC